MGAITTRFKGDRRGATAVIVALTALPLVFAVGMTADYTMAARRRDQINGIADSAALAGLTPTMLSQSATASQTAAQNMLVAQLNTLSGLTYSLSNISVKATDSSTATGFSRTVAISYTAQSANTFGGLLGFNTMTITGSSSAAQTQAPNINYYLLLDTSPSMAIAATTAGIATMVANTSKQGGCAFGCHEINPSSDNLGNPGGEDNFALARSLGVPLRIDLVNTATQSMLSSATTAQKNNNTTYKFGIYTFDYTLKQLTPLGSIATAQTAATNIQQLEVYNNAGYLTQTLNTNDEDTNWDGAMAGLYTGGAYPLPAPGKGTNAPGDTPQEVLFIVSDGVIDENSGGSRLISPVDEFSTWCSKVKAQGIRIAFLYTTYYPLTTNSFYNGNVAPFEAQIGPTYAQNCASSGLYFQVATGGDITAAMTTLFQRTVSTAHLTQ